MPGPGEVEESEASAAPVAPVIPIAAAVPDSADSVVQVSNSGFSRYKPCVLCLRVISVFDTSAGCQDPSIGEAKGCDRLEAVEADSTTSGSAVETPASSSPNADALTELEDAVTKLENNA
jgi:hypothetical protein